MNRLIRVRTLITAFLLIITPVCLYAQRANCRKAILLLSFIFSFHFFAFSQTRFYLNTGTTAALSPAYNAGWNVTTGVSRYEMSTFKDGSTLTNNTTGNSGAAAVRKCLSDQWVSEALAAQTITGTFTGQVQFAQSSITGPSTGQGFLYLRVINSNGTIATEVGTCTTTNLTTTLTNRTLISLNVGTLNITAGQRICIDLGWNYSVGASTTRNCNVSEGSSSGTDLPVNNTTTTVNNPWVQFSQNLVFQTPANDDCAAAVSLTPGASCVNTAGTLKYATPNVATPIGCFAAGTYYDVWYKFVATTFTHTVNLSSLGANFTAPRIQIYQGTCGALLSMGCVSGTSLLQTGLTPGNTYYVRIANFNVDPTGSGSAADFNICVTSQPPAANDACANATTLTSVSTCSSVTGNLQYAASAAPAGACGGATTSTTYDVWFKYVATATNQTVTLSNLGSNLAAATTYIETFSGTCGSLTSLGCQTASTRQTISGLTIGNTYYVRIYVITAPTNTTTANWNFDICIQQPPANDDCAGAVTLTPGTNCVNTAGTLDLATPNAATPLGCFAAGTYYDVWYKFVATTSTHTVTLSSLGTSFTAPQIQIYSGSCGALVSVGCVSGTNLSQTGLTAGNTYYVRIANFNANPSGPGTVANFNICVTSQPPPANDACANATTLTSAIACSSTTSNIQYATSIAPAGACGGATASTTFDVWLKYVATATTQTVTLSNLGSNLSAATTYIEMFSGACGSLVSLGCQAASTRQTISGLTIGNTYYVRVYVTTSPLNTTTANWNFDICIQQPPANDDCAGAVTLTSGASCVNTAGTLDLATPNAATPLGCFAAGTYYDVWYKFVATTFTHTVTLSSLGANFTAPRIQIYQGSCGALVSMSCVSGTTLIQPDLTPGNTYYVRIANFNANPSGLGTVANFNICIISNPPTANDACANATTLTSASACSSVTGNLQYAASAAPAGACGGATTTTTYDVWFKYVATATSETVTLSSLGTNLSAATTYIEMLSGACGSLTSLGCQNASTRQTISGLTIGNTYYVRVYVTTAPTNTTTANWNFNICVQQPPANDDCVGAISLTPGSSCVNTARTLDLATPNAATPLGCFAAGTYYDVWYSFVATTTIETVTLSSLGANFTSPQIQIYSGGCGSLVSMFCTSGTTFTGYGFTVGATYYVRIANLNSNPSGLGTVANFNICITYITPVANDDCTGATTLTSGTSCSNTAGTFINSSPTNGLPGCGNAGSAEVWYTFIAKSNRPVITLSSLGANLSTASPYIQLFSGSCGSLTQLACSVSPLNTAVTPGGVGLSLNSTYYIRITTNTNTGVITSGTYTFNICITDPTSAVVDYAKSYINITDGTAGGTINPGDVLEIRSILVVQRPSGSGANVAIDSVAYYDTLVANKGFALLKDSMALKTNEGKLFRPTSNTYFTDAADVDAAWITTGGAGTDTALQINMGAGATKTVRGAIRHNSKPSNFGSTCIIMATYRVKVNASYGTKIKYGGGAFRYRDTATNTFYTINFPRDSLIVYNSPSGCLNSLSPNNVVGDEVNGTFGTTTGSPVYNQNRGTSPNTSYAYGPFGGGSGPNDYYYSVANNTSASGTIVQTMAKPNAARVFSVWDITGDHTGATNTAKGNLPCNENLPVSSTNPCGYMLVVNTAYRTDVAFQTNISGVCPETYYEVSAWIKNICSKCGCDSNGVGSTGGAYIPTAAGDSSGVRPNIAFQINGLDYYSTGNLVYQGLGSTQAATDTLNTWVKRAFVYKTQLNETSFNVSFRNNAPGGGGNDWAIDDIGIRTCQPTMKYSPSLTPSVCNTNTLTLYDTIKSTYNNYTTYKWQRSTDGGAIWADITGALGPSSPSWNGTEWQYITNYTIPPAQTTLAHDGDKYRMIVATTVANISNVNCLYSDPTNTVTLDVLNCGIPLNIDLLSFNGKIVSDHSHLSWTTSKEDEPIHFDIERSTDAVNFTSKGTVDGHSNYSPEVNHYSFIDPDNFSGKAWYRIAMINSNGRKKYSQIIQLTEDQINFGLSNVINPFRNELAFQVITSANSKIDVSLIDLFGKTLRNKTFTVYSGVNSLSIENTQGLSQGIYILQVKNNNITLNNKVLKK